MIQVRATVKKILACTALSGKAQPCFESAANQRVPFWGKHPVLGPTTKRCALIHEETSSFRRRHYDKERFQISASQSIPAVGTDAVLSFSGLSHWQSCVWPGIQRINQGPGHRSSRRHRPWGQNHRGARRYSGALRRNNKRRRHLLYPLRTSRGL